MPSQSVEGASHHPQVHRGRCLPKTLTKKSVPQRGQEHLAQLRCARSRLPLRAKDQLDRQLSSLRTCRRLEVVWMCGRVHPGWLTECGRSCREAGSRSPFASSTFPLAAIGQRVAHLAGPPRVVVEHSEAPADGVVDLLNNFVLVQGCMDVHHRSGRLHKSRKRCVH